MTAMEFLEALKTYGADVLLLAAGVSLLTALFKKTVLKNCPNKVYVFLPFLIGIVLYAAYRAIATWSVLPFTEDIASTLEGGFGCGSAATIYYILYEQFIRKGKTKLSLSPMLGGILPEEKCEEASDELLAGAKERPEEELTVFVKETIVRYAGDSLSEPELEALVHALSTLLAALNK